MIYLCVYFLIGIVLTVFVVKDNDPHANGMRNKIEDLKKDIPITNRLYWKCLHIFSMIIFILILATFWPVLAITLITKKEK